LDWFWYNYTSHPERITAPTCTWQGGNNDVAFSNQGVFIMAIGPEHPDYLELFYAAFESGGSYPARLIKTHVTADSESPEPQPQPVSPSDEHQEHTEQSSANHQRGS
jgi:hypothetical protein